MWTNVHSLAIRLLSRRGLQFGDVTVPDILLEIGRGTIATLKVLPIMLKRMMIPIT